MDAGECTSPPLGNSASSRGIAIIGMAGRFPGSPSIERLEENLRSGAELISRFQSTDTGLGSSSYVGARGTLEDIEMFDHAYFGMSPAEAALIDPQQRVFLECAAHALQSSGYDPDRYAGEIGVYGGVSTNTYVIGNVYPSMPTPSTGEQFQIMVANDKDYLSTRVSYRLNLRGPSITVQTACSTSLVAIHQACNSLLSGECDIALAGASTVRTPQFDGYHYEDGQVFSKLGRVRPFDDAADGVVMGNGVGIVVLKLLEDALADGDQVHAVIRGTAANNDGAFKASYAAPSRAGQAEVICEALDVAGIDARAISYVEAHGTGTRLGDPVEVSALTEAFSRYSTDKAFCGLGSVKSNVGHLDSAAGVTGLIKTVLMLKSKTIFPTVNFSEPNRSIDFPRTPFVVCDRLRSWDTDALPRRAGVSSFGVGGTNAHVIVEEAPEPPPPAPASGEHALLISALDEATGEKLRLDLAEWIRNNPGANLADIAFTLATGRKELPSRSAFACSSLDEAIRKLEAPQAASVQSPRGLENTRQVMMAISDATPGLIERARWSELNDDRFKACLHRCLSHLGLTANRPFFQDDAEGEKATLTRFLALYATVGSILSCGLPIGQFAASGLGELALAAATGAVKLEDALDILDTFSEPCALDDLAEMISSLMSSAHPGSDFPEGPQAAARGLQRNSAAHWKAVLCDAQGDHTSWRHFSRPEDTILVFVGAIPHEIPMLDGDVPVGGGAPGTAIELVAHLWCRGARVDWFSCYAGEHRRRVSLPLYPFSKVRHWLSVGERPQPNRTPVFIGIEWRPAPLSGAGLTRRNVCILHTSQTRHLAESLGEAFEHASLIDTCELDKGTPAFAAGEIDAWIDITGCDATAKPNFGAVLAAQRHLLAHSPNEDGDARGYYSITHNFEGSSATGTNPSGAFAASLCRTLQHELPWIDAKHCDLDEFSSKESIVRLQHEIRTASPHRWIRYRNGVRYAPEFEVHEDLSEKPVRRSIFQPTDTALVTGASGGLGRLVCNHLARAHGIRKMVLALRTPLPPRLEWKEPFPAGHQDTISAILGLEEIGVEILTIACNFDDPARLREALAEAQSQLGPVRLLVHAAGATDRNNTLFLRKSPTDMAQVLEPKVGGLEALSESLDPAALKRAILFSSVSGIVPSLAAGQADYAMANAFLDAMAGSPTLFGGKAVSIRWPSWRDSGMGEAKSPAYSKTGLLSLSDDEGLLLFDHVLTAQLSGAVLPAIIDRDTFLPSNLLERTPDGPPGRVHPDVAGLGAAPTTVTAWLRKLVGDVLKVDHTDIDEVTPLDRYGADSILLANVAQRLNASLSSDIDVAVLLEHPTLQAFATWLETHHPDDVGRALRTASPEQVKRHGLPHPLPASRRSLDAPRGKQPAAEDQRIAVVGMSCRFPGAPSLDAYKSLLEGSRRAIHRIPHKRWGLDTPYFAGLIDDIDQFDPEFFGLSPQDAAVMDPQALVLLEETLNTIYHAGYDHTELSCNRVGVYVGGRGDHLPDTELLATSPNPILAMSPNYLAANISRFFDFHGPSLVVDTACSSALVAMDLAVAALRNGVIDTAIVAGVSYLRRPDVHALFRRRGLLAKGGHFHIFDERGDGVVLGEGAGVVMLKTERNANSAHDQIYAIVEGLAVNNDGRSAGPTTPNVAMQKDVMRAALAQSGRSAEEVTYIEANGSGSEVTDLLELRALEAVYRPDGGAACILGSAKPNIGHTLCAHGIASFIKVALMLHSGIAPPFLSGEAPSRHYPIEASPFEFCRKAKPWHGRVAAVSAFADGGTNGHVILSRANKDIPLEDRNKHE